MRNLYLLLAPALTLLAASPARAQQPWQPFRPGITYQLSEAATPGDTTHTLRLAAGTLVPGSLTDSLFRFRGRVGRVSEAPSASNCGSKQRLRPDNLFGATLRSQPRAVFVLAAANGRTLLLRPRAALSAGWATGLPGLTASVTSRATAPVLGGAPDSVVTIQFSDGEVLRLSKQYGLLAGPSLDSYLNGRNARRHLTLTALPERGLGTAVTGALAVYDYQPGDVFQYVTHRNLTQVTGTCQLAWQQDSILTRQASRTGDTVTYTLRTRLKTQSFGSAAAPPGLCQAPSGTTLTPPFTSTLRVIGSQSATAGPLLLTSFFQPTGTARAGVVTSASAQSSTHLAGRPEYAQLARQVCATSSPDSVTLTGFIDFGSLTRCAAGLGRTYDHSFGLYNDDLTELTAFRKGSQTWGTFFAAGTLLAARPARATATTTAFPNPCGDNLTARFTLAGAQAVAATLYNALGRAVRTAPPVALPAGPQQLALATAGLPAGVYTLSLHFGLDGHREVLRVAKAE